MQARKFIEILPVDQSNRTWNVRRGVKEILKRAKGFFTPKPRRLCNTQRNEKFEKFTSHPQLK